jgi:ATP-dependent DNA ligase
MQVVHQTPVYVTDAKSGLKKYWRGFILTDGTDWFTQTSWWQTKADGHSSAVQHSTPAQVERKNIGKKNETSPAAQAMSELSAEVKKLRDKKGYVEVGETATKKVILPMLAEKYLECQDDVDFSTRGVFVQPKLDGHRALFDGKQFTTRGGQLHLKHIQEKLAFDTRGLVLDGELMVHPEAPVCAGLSKVERFQLSASAIKEDHPELTPWIRYFVYDVVDEAQPFVERYGLYMDLFNETQPETMIPVPATGALHDAHVQVYLNKWLEQGFEGVMVRHTADGYLVGHRSRQLLKLKPFDSEEFLILDVVPAGKGKAAKAGKFVCTTKDGVEFKAVAKGALELRESYLANRAELIGKEVTVHFEGYSKEGAPRFPRAVGLREVWDK